MDERDTQATKIYPDFHDSIPICTSISIVFMLEACGLLYLVYGVWYILKCFSPTQ